MLRITLRQEHADNMTRLLGTLFALLMIAGLLFNLARTDEVTEDSAAFNCHTMGNKICGPSLQEALDNCYRAGDPTEISICRDQVLTNYTK